MLYYLLIGASLLGSLGASSLGASEVLQSEQGDLLEIPVNAPSLIECASGVFMDNNKFKNGGEINKKFPDTETCGFRLTFDAGYTNVKGELMAGGLGNKDKIKDRCIVFRTKMECFCNGEMCNKQKMKLLNALDATISKKQNDLHYPGALDDVLDSDDFTSITTRLHDIVKSELIATGEITTRAPRTLAPMLQTTTFLTIPNAEALSDPKRNSTVNETSSTSSKKSTILIVGCVIAAILVLVLIFLIILCVVKRKREKAKKAAEAENGEGEAADVEEPPGTEEKTPAEGEKQNENKEAKENEGKSTSQEPGGASSASPAETGSSATVTPEKSKEPPTDDKPAGPPEEEEDLEYIVDHTNKNGVPMKRPAVPGGKGKVSQKGKPKKPVTSKGSKDSARKPKNSKEKKAATTKKKSAEKKPAKSRPKAAKSKPSAAKKGKASGKRR